MTDKVKKLVLLNLPYLIFVYLFDKLCQGVRLAPGADASEKLLHIGQGFSAAFASLAPSFHLVDLCVGAAGAVLIRLVVYSKGKNAKKYRRGIEYGSARWGTPADIAPYMPLLDTRRGKDLMGTFLSDVVLQVLSFVAENERTNIRQRQAEGIAAAKARGVRFGRPPKPLPENFHQTYQQWKNGKITGTAAAKLCGMPLSTFRYRAEVYEKAKLL